MNKKACIARGVEPMISKILSYIFALIVIFVTGNVIVSIASFQENVSNADWFLIFCLLMIMLMGLYYIGNDIGMRKTSITKKEYGKDASILDEELL